MENGGTIISELSYSSPAGSIQLNGLIYAITLIFTQINTGGYNNRNVYYSESVGTPLTFPWLVLNTMEMYLN